MLPPQTIVVEEVLPLVKREVAKALRSTGLSQSEIAKRLGTSQAMVCKYLKEAGRPPHSIRPMVARVSRELIASALSGDDLSSLTDRFCRTVDACIEDGLLHERYRERFGIDPPMSCSGAPSRLSERNRLLHDLSKAILFLKGNPVPDLVPAVKLNLASALQGAVSKDQVASFPGRIPDRDGILEDPMPPEYGASKHLSSILLTVMRSLTGVRAVMNTRFGPDIMNALMYSGSNTMVMDRKGPPIEGLLSERTGGGDLFIVDPGDFGIEPCLYIFGPSPLDVAYKAFKLQSDLIRMKGVEIDGIRDVR